MVLSNKSGIAIIDPSPYFDEIDNACEKLWLKDDTHLNASGHSILAKSIGDYISSNHLVD